MTREQIEAAAITAKVEGVWSSIVLPPDCQNRRYFTRLAKQVPGAHMCGAIWIVPRDAWARFRAPAEQRATGRMPTDAELLEAIRKSTAA